MNPEKDQDRVFDTVDHFKKFGYVMFPEQKDIYRFLSDKVQGSILEAGCGMGLGAYMIGADMATDKLEINVRFAKELYPDFNFKVWDITRGPFEQVYDTVVCVETIEHVEKIEAALKNLIESARKEVWISTPNRSVETPDNPYHVREYSQAELNELINENNPKGIITYECGSSLLYQIIK